MLGLQTNVIEKMINVRRDEWKKNQKPFVRIPIINLCMINIHVTITEKSKSFAISER